MSDVQHFVVRRRIRVVLALAAFAVSCNRSNERLEGVASRQPTVETSSDHTTRRTPPASPAAAGSDRPQRTIAELRKACAASDREACLDAAKALRRGRPTEDDLHLADTYECQGGDADRCKVVASKAQTACSSGKIDACAELADYLRRGAGLPPNGGEARRLYEKVCRDRTYADNYVACNTLSKMWQTGEGGPRDLAVAAKYKHTAETIFSNMMAKSQGLRPGSVRYSLGD